MEMSEMNNCGCGEHHHHADEESKYDFVISEYCQAMSDAEVAASVEDMRQLLAGQVAGSVRWEECLRRAVAAGADTVIEFGPGNVLTGLARRTVAELKLININSTETLGAVEF